MGKLVSTKFGKFFVLTFILCNFQVWVELLEFYLLKSRVLVHSQMLFNVLDQK